MSRDLLHWLPAHPDLGQAFAALKTEAAALSGAELLTRVAALAGHQLDFIETARLDKLVARALAKNPEPLPFASLRLAWLSSWTVEHLMPAVRVAGLRHRVLLESHVAPFGMVRQEAFEPSPALTAFKPEVMIFTLDHHSVLNELPLSISVAELDARVDAAVGEQQALWAAVREQHRCSVLQHTVPSTASPLFGAFDNAVPGTARRAIARYNEKLTEAAVQDGVLLLDLDAASAELGHARWFDTGRWLHAKQLIDPGVSHLYGDLVARQAAALRGLTRKCLVLDLDHTLWGGVVGDDGVDGLTLGQGSAAGEAFAAFQRHARRLRDRGIVLAVCSKNDLAVAEGAFRDHPEMVLKRDDISVFVANWNDKASNLRDIAERLNIGVDALAFFDDNPAERALVRQELPQVAVLEVPADPAGYVRCLSASGVFDVVSFTDDDRKRAGQYEANAKREEAAGRATDMVSFLMGLDMRMPLRPVSEADLPRVTQLINKTNQFNLTTRRYTEAEVRALARAPGVVAFSARLLDRFGDNGLISVLIAKPLVAAERATYLIDTWLMSCRVLGRGVEQALLAELVSACRAKGAEQLVGEFLPTAKNAMVKDLYPRLGFVPEATVESAGARFALSLHSFVPRPHHIRVEVTHEQH